MNKFVKYFGITFVSIIAILYLLFLVVPFFLTGLINSYNEQIVKFVEESCGLKVKIENIKLLTTPKLTIGGGVRHLEVALSSGETFLTADNVSAKLSLIPIIIKKIELDSISADNVNFNIKVKKDGDFLIADLINSKEQNSDNQQPVVNSLPYGLKLSNHLPNIQLNNYNISFIDISTDKTYSIYGNNFSINDFIFNKKIKLVVDGKFMLQDRVQFNYDLKLLNKIMPDVDFNDFIFTSAVSDNAESQNFNFNIIDFFDAIHKNYLTADLNGDLKVFGNAQDVLLNGFLNISNLGIAVNSKNLPKSNIDLKFKHNKTDIYAKLYTSVNEITELIGDFKTGNHPSFNLNCKSNARFESILSMLKSIAKSFEYNDLDTLTAKGGVDADFSISSNLKKVDSSGYLKINSASLAYKIYNILVDNINADIDFSNNIVNIKNAGFSIFSHPFKLNGTISHEADANINIIADNLQLKSLLLALGQLSVLKENNINSGTFSMNASLKGRLDKIVPKVNVSIDNVNVKNLPSNTNISLLNSKINFTTDWKKSSGDIAFNSMKINNPLVLISVPNTKISLNEKDIILNSAYVLLNNSRIDFTGKVSDYMGKNIKFLISGKGNILSSDIKNLFPKELKKDINASGKLPLVVDVTGNDKSQDIAFNITSNPSNYVSIVSVDQFQGKSTVVKGNLNVSGDSLKFNNTGIFANGTEFVALSGSVNNLSSSQKLKLNIETKDNLDFVIPGFPKSKINAKADIDILGSTISPKLKGNVSVPSVKIPEIPLSINNLQISLDGPILKGKGTISKFVSGGIVAENLSSDFNLINNIFYLTNILGDAFSGKINGNISYNIQSGHIGVNFKGIGLDAQKAIAGAAGLKNALSGKLNFNANVTLHGATDVEMMKNLKGNASFDITDGTLGNIGRFENFLLAQNLQSNSIIKAAVNSVSSLPAIKNTAQFKSIKGNLNFSNGWTNLNPITTSGPSMSYYITGKYNLLNSTANVIILGRISAEIVSLLGPLGDLSVSKLTSYIPKFGALTGNIINAMTSDPKNEKISSIPQLSTGNKNYKDFKVVFNGGVESKSSVKSFKWLSKCDTSDIEKTTVKEQVQQTKQAVKTVVQEKKEAFDNHIQEQKQSAQEAKQQLQDAAAGLKNLKNLFKTN